MKVRVEGFGAFREWFPKDGARPSMKPGTVVMVKYRDGSEHLARYGYEMAEESQWRWDKENEMADIVAYALPQLVVFDGPVACQHGGMA